MSFVAVDPLSTWFTGVPLIDSMVRDGVCGGDVVELFGSSGVGKSELMLQLAIKCVLPAELGGSDSCCVLFDNDCKFDARRLVVVLLATLQRVRQQSDALSGAATAAAGNDDASVFDPLLRQSLQRIRVIRPRDVVDFVLALRALPDLLDSLPARCRLLLLDSISCWHWSLQNDADGSLYDRDLAALAQGLREVLDPEYLHYREASAHYFASHLSQLGVPVVQPFGLHAVYVDARAMLPHIPVQQLPGQALACELFLQGGVRSVEIGTLMFGYTDRATGKPVVADHDLVRLCLPRRVYTQSHIDWVIESFAELMQRREHIRGLDIVEEAPLLRAFTAKLRPVQVPQGAVASRA